jgi:DNA polymerase
VTGFDRWRERARALLASGVRPEDASFDGGLFHEAVTSPATPYRIPRPLAGLLEAAACNADPERWALMYRVLWRVARGGEHDLLDDPADTDVVRIEAMVRAVDREVHRMHAFVRFNERAGNEEGDGLYEAWFEPEHDVIRRAAPFFRDRFAGMRWIIATPQGAAAWDRETLSFTEGPLRKPEGDADSQEPLWRTYYASIFNPARMNPALMRQHMPQRYWKNMPEAAEIARLSRHRVASEAPASSPRWAAHVQVEVAEAKDLDACRRCSLWERATQAVPGEGTERATIMLVGEQPGDEEDLRGKPFVGPAGRVLDRALAEAGLSRDAIYVTNAVKHFKWEPRGKRRLHKTPAQQEIEACHAWLDGEIARVAPRVIVAMGATAALALTGRKLSIAGSRGASLQHARGATLVVTYHPSAVLRGEERSEETYRALREDLARAASLCE